MTLDFVIWTLDPLVLVAGATMAVESVDEKIGRAGSEPASRIRCKCLHQPYIMTDALIAYFHPPRPIDHANGSWVFEDKPMAITSFVFDNSDSE